MNERMLRVGGKHCAAFITAFDETSPSVGSPLDNAIWLVWKYEGDNTLYNLMEKKEFPYNLEPLLLNRELKLPRGTRRKLVTIRMVMKQLVEALQACHNSGAYVCCICCMGRALAVVGCDWVAISCWQLTPCPGPAQLQVLCTVTPSPRTASSALMIARSS